MRCIALDDEPLALKLITAFSKKIPDLELVAIFTNPLQARSFIEQQSIDLLFLDIDMLEVNGVDFARTLDPSLLLIFTTAHREYALEGFELSAVDYLLKPFDFNRFQQAMDKAMREQARVRKFIMVYAEYVRKKIFLDEIEHIESMQDYVVVQLLNGTKIITLGTMKAMLERLPADQFMRIHRSYIVSLDQIREMNQRKVRLSTIWFSVGESYYKELCAVLDS